MANPGSGPERGSGTDHENGPGTDCGTGKTLISGLIGPALLLFALPTLGWSMLQSANGSMNALWIGRLQGQDALVATTNGNLVMFLLATVVFGFGMSATIPVGQSMGRGDVDAAPAGAQIGPGPQP